MLKFFLIHAKCFLCGYWDLFFVRSTTAFLSIDRNRFQVKSDTSAGTWANHFIFFTFTSIGKVNAQSSIHHFFIFYDFLSKFVQKIFVPIQEPLRRELLSFYSSIIDGTPIVVTGQMGINAIRICEKVIDRINNQICGKY